MNVDEPLLSDHKGKAAYNDCKERVWSTIFFGLLDDMNGPFVVICRSQHFRSVESPLCRSGLNNFSCGKRDLLCFTPL